MADSPSLSPVTADDPDGNDLDAVFAVADAARDADGADPFNEQTRLDLASGRRTAWLASVGGTPAGAAATGHGELDLVVTPEMRRTGIASAVLERLLPELEADVSAWSHGDHPAASALAVRFRFDRVRTLLRLRLPELPRPSGRENGADAGIRITPFDPERDASDWLALNARAFATHPEQGRVSAADLTEREAEPWFDAADFLIAREDAAEDARGRMLGFHWMKLEPGSDEGEVYVLGVDPDSSGRGLGRRLLTSGLRRMAERGRTHATLYVEGDNAPALALYRDTGFVDDTVDVQYRRTR